MREADSRPDLAIVDSELSDAEALIETLRARDATRRLPVAVLLAEGTEPQRTRALASLANVFLEPPAGAAWDALLQRISKVATRQDVRVPVISGYGWLLAGLIPLRGATQRA
jgi:DNA-binding response OmpR family regulator